MPRIFTIGPELPFADALVDGLLHGGVIDRVEEAPLTLSQATILLPTRRACRALREAFLRQSDSGAMLLPRIRPIGDLDEDEVGPAGLLESSELPPALAPLHRRFLLARLILGLEPDQGLSLLHLGTVRNDLFDHKRRDLLCPRSELRCTDGLEVTGCLGRWLQLLFGSRRPWLFLLSQDNTSQEHTEGARRYRQLPIHDVSHWGFVCRSIAHRR